MKSIFTAASAIAVALAMTAVASPSKAALLTFAGGSASGSTAFNFTRDTTDNVGGVLSSTSPGWTFNFTNAFPTLQALGNLSATFAFSATTDEGFTNLPGIAGNAGFDGGFSFLYAGPTKTVGGVTVTHGENLLTATFTNAWIQGTGGTGDADATTDPDAAVIGTVDAASGLVVFGPPDDFDFSFTLTGVTGAHGLRPGLAGCSTTSPIASHNCFLDGSSYNSFTAGGSGSFAADSVKLPGVPEPSTWGLMIVGFGGAGALLRRRRTTAVAA